MVSQITLGNLGVQNGRNVVSGSASGLDTEGLIKALTEARRLPAVQLETKNESLASQRTALGSLQSLMNRFRTAVDALRNPPGIGTASKNIFEYRTANLSSSNGSASSYMSVSVQPGAAIQNFSIDEVERLAREAKQESNSFLLPGASTSVVTAADAQEVGKFSAGTFSLRGVDGQADVDITFAEGDSLNTIASKFNAVKDRTGIQATVIKVADGDPDDTFKILFTGTKTGAAYDFDLRDAGTLTGDPDGVFSQTAFAAPSQGAQNARFKLDGVTIERATNSMNDVIDGINFTLLQPTPPGTTMTLSIAPDTEIVKNAVLQFVDVYNEFRLFAAKQQELGADGLPTETAVLSSNSALRSAINQIGTEMNRVVAGITGNNPTLLSDIGITFDNFAGDEENPATKNIMVVDSEKLTSMLAANFDGVRKLFEFQMVADNPDLISFSRTNELAATSMTLTIDRTNNIYQASYTNSANQLVTVDLDMNDNGSGITLTGRNGTGLAGLSLIFGNNSDATINVSFTQGFGDRMFNVLEGMLNTSNGTLTTALQEISTQTTRNTEEIAKIDASIVTYRDRLVEMYSRLEAALTQANRLLTMLDAQASARNNA